MVQEINKNVAVQQTTIESVNPEKGRSVPTKEYIESNEKTLSSFKT